MSNKNVPSIPEPTMSAEGLYGPVLSLKEAVELITGQRGSDLDRAVTFRDLVDMGLIIPDQIPK